MCPILLLIIRYVLSKENKRRDTEPPDDMYDNVYIETTENGKMVERKVDKVRSGMVWKGFVTDGVSGSGG
jgi:MFS transporter, ACS family, allantoate permease